MLVKQILDNRPDAEIETIAPDATVEAAARRLSEKRIGALVVSEGGGRVAGIFSERDIVRELGRRGTACMADRVADLMTADITGCATDDTAVDVLRKMTDGRFRHMPVMKEGRMVGLISIGDVVSARLNELAMEKDALEGMIMGH